MKLISCNIIGFGRLRNLEIDFSEGLNAVQKENGWGKTTFAVFLETMLYGFKGGGKKTAAIREKYRPWDGGPYGGILSFETEGRIFTIERSFGAKESEDSFALYDQRGALLEDAPEDVGRDLFSVDRFSFEKSIYFPQNALDTRMTDELNAKMGDMASFKEDIDGVDAAIRRLENSRLSLVRSSKNDPGELYALRQEILRENEELAKRPAVADALEKQRAVLEEKRLLLDEKKSEKEALSEGIAEQSKKEQELGVYREKKETFEKLNLDFGELKNFFKKGFPSEEVLGEMEEAERELSVNRSHLQTVLARIPSEEEGERLFAVFEGHSIDDSVIGDWNEKVRVVLALRTKAKQAVLSEEEKNQLSGLTSFFEKKNPSADEIEQAMSDAALLAQCEGQVDTLEEQYKNAAKASSEDKSSTKAGAPKVSFYAGLGVAVLLVGSLSFGKLLGGAFGWMMAMLCAALAAGILGVLFSEDRKSRARKKERRDIIQKELLKLEKALSDKKMERDRQKEVCKEFISGFNLSPADTYSQMIGEIQRKKETYSHLLQREEQTMAENSSTLEELSALQVQLYVVLAPVAGIYGLDLNERHEEGVLIEKLKEDKRTYDVLCENLDEKARLERSIWDTEMKLIRFFERFPGKVDNLVVVRQKLAQFRDYEERLKGLAADIEAFESTHNIDEDTRSVIAIQEEQAVLDAQLEEILSQVRKAEETEAELSDKLGELDELAQSLEELGKKENELLYRLDKYEKTILYLGRAKEQFLSKYMGSLRGVLLRYLQMMDVDLSQGRGTAAFSLDLDLSIRLNRGGSLKEAELFSSGYRDLFSFCTRLALVDVLYERERPFMLLDDPFSNLDEHKLEKVLSLLRNMGNRRQIIYFTCQGNRMP